MHHLARTRGASLIAIAAFAVCAVASAADLHVAPNGSDATGDGSPQKPFATLQKAVIAVRSPESGVTNTILLAPGRYFTDTPITIDERDSGLTIRGIVKGATAEIYGGLPVTGWEKWKGNVWRAKVPVGTRFFNLVVDGRIATMAQWPNAGSGYGIPTIDKWDFADAQMFSWLGVDWFSSMGPVTAVNEKGRVAAKIDSGKYKLNNRQYVRGALEFLDEPGEWCLKHKEGYVYYWPKSGTPADHVIVRTISPDVIVIRGRSPQTPAKGISISNVSLIGSDAELSMPVTMNNETKEAHKHGFVFASNVERLSITGCRIQAAGVAGVWLDGFAQNCVVESCLFVDMGFTGINSTGFAPGKGDFKSAAESYVNKGHRFENNFIHNIGLFVGHAAGIKLFQTGDTLITRNEIGESPRFGIAYDGLRFGVLPKKMYGVDVTFSNHFDFLHTRNIRIIGNELYSTCRNSDDQGAIQAWGPGRDNFWERNAIHDVDQTIHWDAWLNILFLDDGCHFHTLRDNIITHCAGGSKTTGTMLKCLNQTIENNFIVDCRMGRVLSITPFVEPFGNLIVRRNLFASDGQSSRYDASRPATHTGKSTGMDKIPAGFTGITEVDHNAITPNDPNSPNPYAAKKLDLNSVFGDMKLQRGKPDWDITFRDYSLAPDSPALKVGFKPIDTTTIGLRSDFPFDTVSATRRVATDKIQAEGYQRMRGLRTLGGTGIYHLTTGSWAKYANIDFGNGVTKAVLQLRSATPEANGEKPFIRRYGDAVTEAMPFKGDKQVETLAAWEITKPYTKPGKTGTELFDEIFPPENEIAAGDWMPLLAPTTSRAGVTTAPGVVDFDVANGEENANACAYARCSIYAPVGRTNATMTVSCGSGVKVWLNGALVIAENKPGTYSETEKGIIKQGWNTVLVKVNQDAAKWTPKTTGDGNFWFTFGTVASGCGNIVYLPGLPTEERAQSTKSQTAVELRLSSPEGKLIGRLAPGQTECPVEKTTGIHNFFLVFPGAPVSSVDWFNFE
jgi:hypothetical protein